MTGGGTVLQNCYRTGANAWPQIAVPLARFEALVGHRLRDGELDGAELYLACGCALGDPAALRAFDDQIAGGVPAALRRMKLDDAAIADVLQQLRVRLFVGEPPRILAYAGTGKLGALVHVTAKRLALDAMRSQRRLDPVSADEHLAEAATIGGDAAMLLDKAELRQALRRAFEEAAAQLARRDRTLLRLSVLDGLSIDELATMHRVHRATIARWLVAARDQLTSEARSRFIALAGLADADVGHAGALVESQLSVSLGRLLRTHDVSRNT